jgi:dTDP-4-dehydrorhamnose 3,5-epimerase
LRPAVIFRETDVDGAVLIELERYEDERGFFARAWSRDEFAGRGLETSFVQANVGHSRRRGTLRGLHYQLAPHAEVKLVRCIRGAVFDVVVDLRPESPTHGRWHGVELSASNGRALYVPAGCAHGYLALVDASETFYEVTAAYTPHAERGIRWNDPGFAIRWPDVGALVVSEKDRGWPDYVA